MSTADAADTEDDLIRFHVSLYLQNICVLRVLYFCHAFLDESFLSNLEQYLSCRGLVMM